MKPLKRILGSVQDLFRIWGTILECWTILNILELGRRMCLSLIHVSGDPYFEPISNGYGFHPARKRCSIPSMTKVSCCFQRSHAWESRILDLWLPIFLTGAKRREWMGMGVAGIMIDRYYGSFPHSRSEAPVNYFLRLCSNLT